MLSLCIPTYNRTTLLYESFAQVINDARISEIVIVDDHSTVSNWNDLRARLQEYVQFDVSLKESIGKIELYRNAHNLGCYYNKRKSVELAKNPWVILFDSDNILTKEYLDVIWGLQGIWDKNVLLQPEFAKPHFDFRKYSDELIWARNVKQFVNDPTFTTMLNAMNYFVNREEYLATFEDRPEPWTADSLLQNYNWLAKGNGIYVTPGLQYEHRVHDGSHYKEHHRKTGNLYNELVHKLKSL